MNGPKSQPTDKMSEPETNSTAIAGSSPVPCSACEARVYDWLKAHTEAWYGPQKKWTNRQQDKFYVELSLLTLFTKDFRFPEQNH